MECFKNAQQIVERHLSNYKLEEGTQEPSHNKYKALKLTLMFNIGYFHEQNYQLDEASNLYKQITSEYPEYFDAYLRLAFLARKRGDFQRCLFWIDEASKSKAKAPINQHCLKGKILFEMKKYPESANEFKFVIEKILGDDSYSFLGLADIAFKNAIDYKPCGSSE